MKPAQEMGSGRIEAFSDGVFAIAITLLVLDLIEIPHGAAGEPLLQVYLHDWHRFLAFAVGFITILVCWINHHFMFGFIRKGDSRFVWLNGFLLFLVTFIPFPTAVMAQYIGTQPRTAVGLFGFGYFMMAAAYYLLWAYACDHGLLDCDSDPARFRATRAIYRYATIYNLAAFLLCFVSTSVAIGMYLVMFAVFAFPGWFAERLRAREQRMPTTSPGRPSGGLR